MSERSWIRVGIGLLLLSIATLLYQIVVPKLQPLPIYMTVPALTLTDQDGQPFDLNQTRGKVVILSPIYTHCPDICPLTTGKLKQLQDDLKNAGLNSQVQFVTFTVDPERDTPDVLKLFSAAFNVDRANWVFLTGTSEQIQVMITTLGIYVERVYYIQNTPFPESTLEQLPTDAFYLVNHSDILFLVDRQGRVRALPPGSRTDVNDAINLVRQLVENNGG